MEGRAALGDWLQFFRANSHLLRSYPHGLFQLAANEPDALAPAQTALTLEPSRRSPWFRWINKPQHPPPCVLVLADHRYFPDSSCAFSPDGRLLASAAGPRDEDGNRGSELIVWDADDGTELFRVTHGAAGMPRCGFSPDGELVVWSSGDSFQLRRSRTGEIVPSRGMPPGIVLGWGWVDDRMHALCSVDQQLSITDVVSGRVMSLHATAKAKTGCAFSFDGRRVAVGCADWTVRVWDVQTGRCLAELGTKRDVKMDVYTCSWSPDGKWLATGGLSDAELIIWDATTLADETCRSFGASNASEKRSLHRTLTSAFSHDSQHVASGAWPVDDSPEAGRILSGANDLPLKLWDVRSGQQVAAADAHRAVRGCAFHPSAPWLATTGGRDVKMWDVQALKDAAANPRHWALVGDCCFLRDGRSAVTISEDKSIKVWDVVDGSEVRTVGDLRLRPITCASSPRAHEVAVCSAPDHGNQPHDEDLCVWNLGDCRRSVLGSDVYPYSCSYSRDGSKLLVEQFRTAETNYKSVSLWDASSGTRVALIAGATAAAWSPEGRRFATIGPGRVLRLWDAAARRELWAHPHDRDVNSCAFSPDGSLLVASDGFQHVMVDARNGNPVRTLGIDSPVRGGTGMCAFSPDGRSVLITRAGGTVWDVRTGATIASDLGTDDEAQHWQYAPDGRHLLAASSADPMLRIWNVATGTEVARLWSATVFRAVRWHVNHLLAGDEAGTVMILEARGFGGSQVVTAVYAYSFDRKNWESEPSARCPSCGESFAVPAATRHAIDEHMGRERGEAVAWLKMPDAAWTDRRLSVTCPACMSAMVMNPFLADSRNW